MNTLALRLADGARTGWPGAEDDLAAGLLRVLHDRSFRDDPTRLLRMARYAARLGFEPEPWTGALAAAAVTAGAPATVTGERIGAELRLLGREPQPAALIELERWGLGAALVPGFTLDPPLVERALALCPPDVRADLLALGSAVRGADPDAVAARARALAFPAPEARRSPPAPASTRCSPSSTAPRRRRPTSSCAARRSRPPCWRRRPAPRPRATGSIAAATPGWRSPATTCSPKG